MIILLWMKLILNSIQETLSIAEIYEDIVF